MTSSRKSLPALPGAFNDRIREQFPDEHDDFLRALEKEPVTAIRMNPHKPAESLPEPASSGHTTSKDVPSRPVDGTPSGGAGSSFHSAGRHRHLFAGMRPVPWSENGWFLPERPSFTLDPLLHAGSYYVQEAASMFLERVLVQPEIRENSEVILDACAAPGGKTTLIAAQFPESLVVANEVIRSRVAPLLENSIKWGTGNIAITRSETVRVSRLTSFFDLVVADAPCSGEGLFRKDPASRDQWSTDNALHCSRRQRSILIELWETVRPGGFMIYTTCTFNPEENEQNVAWLLEQTGGECLKLPAGELIFKTGPAVRPETTPDGKPGIFSEYRAETASKDRPGIDSENPTQIIEEITAGPVTGYGFYPHRTPGEGFFLAVIRKPASAPHDSARHTGNTPRPGTRTSQITEPDSSLVQIADSWFSGDSFDWFRAGDRLHRIHRRHMDHLHALTSNVPVLYAGTETGKVIRDEVRPSPAAALDIHLDKERFPQIECTREEALRYLRRDPLPVRTGAEKGWHLATYRGLPLGWLKNIGSRMNNYHPKEWRIRFS